MNHGLREELLRRRDADQEARRRFLERPDDEEATRRMRAVDADNAEWLRRILREAGWPKRSEVGAEASSAAWLLAQHAHEGWVFQRECLRLLAAAVAAGEASADDLRHLTDRVLMAEGRPQRYGTIYRPGPDGQLELYPVEGTRPVRTGEGPLIEWAQLLSQRYRD
jgi:sulfite reductase beta subunit-like hemoprotein